MLTCCGVICDVYAEIRRLHDISLRRQRQMCVRNSVVQGMLLFFLLATDVLIHYRVARKGSVVSNPDSSLARRS